MQVIRRAAFRVINSSIATPRTITTRTPFVLRSKVQPLSATLFRRFASNDVDSSEQSSPSSADKDDSSSIRSAIDSATESASTYASNTADSIAESYESAKESVADYAQAAGAAAGFSAPRGRRDDRPANRERVERPALTPTNSIYIGNLLFDCTEEDIKREFSKCGDISKVTIATDLRGMSKGFAYIEFATIEQATAAIEAKNQSIYEGRRLIVNYQNTTKREFKTNEPSKTLFIGNLAFEMSDADLTKLFKEIRNVVDVRVAIDRRTGQPRGFAHAEFTDIASAQQGLQILSGKEIYNRVIRVDFSGGGVKRESGEGGYGGDRGDRGGRNGYGGGERRGGYGGDRGNDRRSGGYGGDRGGRGGYGGGERRGGDGFGGDRGGERY